MEEHWLCTATNDDIHTQFVNPMLCLPAPGHVPSVQPEIDPTKLLRPIVYYAVVAYSSYPWGGEVIACPVEVVLVGSLQPHHPGVSHVPVVLVECEVVFGGASVVVDVVVVVIGSRQFPNHPYELQVAVVMVVVDVEVVDTDDVVVRVVEDVDVSSLQPHHPGVLQVEVRVAVVDEVELDDDIFVVVSEPLLWNRFQLKQSTHSSSGTHFGTVS
jgi:hypothetical protein